MLLISRAHLKQVSFKRANVRFALTDGKDYVVSTVMTPPGLVRGLTNAVKCTAGDILRGKSPWRKDVNSCGRTDPILHTDTAACV